jgi:hypothetical protein
MYQKDGVDACRNMLCELQELKGFLLQDSKIDYDTPVNVGSINLATDTPACDQGVREVAPTPWK